MFPVNRLPINRSTSSGYSWGPKVCGVVLQAPWQSCIRLPWFLNPWEIHGNPRETITIDGKWILLTSASDVSRFARDVDDVSSDWAGVSSWCLPSVPESCPISSFFKSFISGCDELLNWTTCITLWKSPAARMDSAYTWVFEDCRPNCLSLPYD